MFLSQFELFCHSHLLALGVFLILAFLLTTLCKKGYRRGVSKSLGIICLLSIPLQITAYLISDGYFKLENYIPFHLCDVAAALTGLALIQKKPLIMELAYFWGLAGTLQGLITPDLHFEFPHPIFLSFFWLHGFVVLGAILLPLGLDWRPRKRSVLRVFLWLQVYVIAALFFNFILGTNFAFLSEKPDQGSLMDHIGPVPWHRLSMEALSLCFFFLLSIPFYRTAKQS